MLKKAWMVKSFKLRKLCVVWDMFIRTSQATRVCTNTIPGNFTINISTTIHRIEKKKLWITLKILEQKF